MFQKKVFLLKPSFFFSFSSLQQSIFIDILFIFSWLVGFWIINCNNKLFSSFFYSSHKKWGCVEVVWEEIRGWRINEKLIPTFTTWIQYLWLFTHITRQNSNFIRYIWTQKVFMIFFFFFFHKNKNRKSATYIEPWKKTWGLINDEEKFWISFEVQVLWEKQKFCKFEEEMSLIQFH